MGHITLQQAADWCGGYVDPKYKDITFLGACNDTRKILPGQLFVALQGARDGNDFVQDAMEKGAAAALCSRPVGDIPVIVVEDTRKALGDIARQERLRIGMKVVGITGSVGKSTTKEMVACVLQGTYRVAKTPVNHNNDIGMPMAVLSMPEDTQVAVLEMGMNHFGEMAYLTSIAQPDIAVIINIGTAHIEHLGSMEGILQAKLEIREGMAKNGTLVLNGDDALLWNSQKDMAESNLRFFGVNNPESHIRGADIQEENGVLQFRVTGGKTEMRVAMNLEGRHYVPDALAAVAVALELGVTPQDICQRLKSFENMAGRQEIFQAKGYTIIKDCYNASPESMVAALQVLKNKPGRHVAVLGDMLELGICSQAEHYKVGRIAAETVDILLAYGPNSVRVLNGARTGGMSENAARAFTDQKWLVQVLKNLAKPGDAILFKGSRGMQMELALEAFLQEEEAFKVE